MEAIEREVAKTEPNVAFRATPNYTHKTWAKTFQSRPELYIRPQSLEEIQKIVTLARRCRRRIVVVGSGHSPSDLTCTSSWMVNLDDYGSVLKIDAQKIAGAIATATHGSSLKHGILSENVRSLRIVLANGQAVRCSSEQNPDLFRAALVSLGALGIITEVEFQMTDNCNIEWEQKLVDLDEILNRWQTDLWTKKEFTRVWWMPYMKRAIIWSAERTSKALRPPVETWYGGSVGFHTYHNLLWLSNYMPFILPAVEWFVFGMQYGFKTGSSTTAVEELRTGLLMNCLYSQFVNEWALPLHKGREAITRLSAWINGEAGGGGIPFSAKGLWVHCPIEVRVSDSTHNASPRPFLDNTCADGPTLYLNATLYRAYLQDPPCRDRYYEAFEWLMRELGGKPHYAKNFIYTSSDYMQSIFGEDLKKWTRVRNEADPEGMFLGEWHRRSLGLGQTSDFALEELEVSRSKASNGGQMWVGEINRARSQTAGADALFQSRDSKAESPSASSSGESFDMMHGAEAEKSAVFDRSSYDDHEDEGELTDRGEERYYPGAKDTITGTAVFQKM